MIKECLKTYLDKYFECYKNYMGTYPTVPYDEDEKSSLWYGEVDEEDYIQWMYKEKDRQTKFSELEDELDLVLPDAAKEFYNSYYFLQLQGFYNGENVSFDSISDCRDILQDLRNCIFEMKEKKYLHMGIYSNMDLALCMEIDTGAIVWVDYDCKNVEKIADSLEEFLNKMTPMKQMVFDIV